MTFTRPRRFHVHSFCAIALAASLAACGGGGGDDSEPAATSASGAFVDSAVQGLDYYIDGVKAGTTDAAGRFTYITGKAVTFRVGNVTLGTTAVADLSFVTPAGLSSSAASVNNILVLLQSLDADNNPANGIVIPTDTAARLTTAVDLSASGTTLASVQADLPTLQLISAEAALTHFVTAASALAPTTAASDVTNALVGYWHFQCNGDGESLVVEIERTAANRIHFKRSLVRAYANANCTGSYEESTRGGATEQDYATILGGRALSDGRLEGYAVTLNETSLEPEMETGVLSADRNTFTIGNEAGRELRRLTGYAFPN